MIDRTARGASWTKRGLIRTGLLAALSLGVIAAGSGVALAEADKNEAGNGLIVPPKHQSLGTVYHVHKGRDAQITFLSEAPLEDIKGVSNQVIGYGVLDKSGSTPRLAAGEFHLPIASMDTGIPLRNEHMQGSRWLNASEHPDIVFAVAESRNVRKVKEQASFTSYEMTLVGDMTIKGVTREMQVPATIVLMPESERTRSRAPGDLMAIRASYTITLADFGIEDPIVGDKLANTIEIDTRLFLSTVSMQEMMEQRRRSRG